MPAATAKSEKGKPASAGQSEKIRELIVRRRALLSPLAAAERRTCSSSESMSRGNNAVEIPQFDLLVDQLEAKIHDLAGGAAGK